MLNKEVTRKQFLLSVASLAGVLMISGIPQKVLTSVGASSREGIIPSTNNRTYGSDAYGGN